MAKPKEPSYPSHFSKVTVCRYVSGIHSAVADPDLQIIGGVSNNFFSTSGLSLVLN